LQWLGGDGSEALTGDTPVLDLLMFGEHTRAMQAFDVHRAAGVSHQALMSPRPVRRMDPGIAIGEEGRNDPAG
jgi:hypothetical protein